MEQDDESPSGDMPRIGKPKRRSGTLSAEVVHEIHSEEEIAANGQQEQQQPEAPTIEVEGGSDESPDTQEVRRIRSRSNVINSEGIQA